MKPQKVLSFHEFCDKVINLKLTVGQRVIAKVAFGDMQPSDLDGEEKSLALEMFGGLETVSQSAKKYVCMMLGRGSGKTTLCSAYAVYQAVTHDVSRSGVGDVPYVIVVAPDKPTAQLSVRMSREMIRSNQALERLVVSDTTESIQLRRPDGRMVKIEAFAATRGGSAMRGRTIISFIMDEACFFTSSGTDGARDYAVNDRDIFGALKPRLLPDGKGLLISTPWPVETLMGEMFNANWRKCETCLAIKAPTVLVRGDDPVVRAMVDDEMARDPDNARRELYCELDGLQGGEFFDMNAIKASEEEATLWPLEYNPKLPVAVGCDLGFTRDSSAVVVVQYDGKYYRVVYADELRPSPGKPLRPGEVIAKFAKVAKRYGASGVVCDAYYRESLKEHLQNEGMVIFSAPEGTKGKAEVFQRTRAVLHEGLCKIPLSNITRRMVAQCRLVSARPAPGGTVTIRIPRKIGMGHGDIVSAWVLAVHRLAYAQVNREIPMYEPGTPGWREESSRRLREAFDRQQANYLKSIEAEGRKRLDKRTMRQFNP